MVLLLSLGSIWLVTYLITSRLQDEFTKVLFNQQFSSVSYAALEVEEKTLLRFGHLEATARSITPQLLRDPDKLRSLLAGSTELHDLFGVSIGIFSSAGDNILRYPASLSQAGFTITDLEYFQEVMATGKRAIGKPRIGRVSQKPGVAFAVPVRQGAGPILGVLAGFSSILDPTLFGQFERATMGQSGWTEISDAKYRLIAAISDPTRNVLQPFPQPGVNKMLDRFAAGYSGSGVSISSQGKEVLSSAQHIPGTSWFVQTVLPTKEAFAPLRDMVQRAYGIALLLSLATSLVAWLFVWRALRTLKVTTTQIHKMADRREPLQAWPKAPRGEIGDLMLAFNILCDQRLFSETELARLNRALRLLGDCNQVVVRADTESQLLNEICRLVVESGGYLMAWVGFGEHDAAKSVRPVAGCGHDQGYLDKLQVSWDGEQENGRGPAGTAIRTGSTQVSHDGLNNPRLAFWREALLKRGCHSCVALALSTPTQTLGALMLYAADPQAFTPDEVQLLEELASNMAFGVETLRARHELDRHRQELQALVAEATVETVALNTALQSQARKAESATQAKSDFLATMSHEIRTPLNAVVGLTQLLADSPLNRRQRDYADKIKLSAQALRALVDDILDFSRIEAGVISLEQVPFSLNTVLRTTAAIVSVSQHGKPIEALFDVARNVPDALIGDSLRLQQILLNLASNAVKFTDAGEVVVSVRCLVQDAGRAMLQFAVRDTGIGIAPEQLDRVFEVFTQGGASIGRQYGGSGLGLAISTQLVQLMGGEITVDSIEGEGSTFRFTLAFNLADGQGATVAEHPANLNILIVDDHPLARDILKQTCAHFDWQATALDCGLAALEELRRSAAQGRDYDLMLLDWRMPGMNGIEMLRQAQVTPGIGLPLVILMAGTFELEEAAAASDELYLDGILAKPVTPTSLLEAVQRAYSGEVVALEQVPRPSSRRLAGMRLLVAEDNEINQQVIEHILTRAGAEVVLVNDGRAAVWALGASGARFDVVLMDLRMPVMDGYTATRIIREEMGLIDLPIIAVTAHALPEDREKTRLAGMVGHLSKPIDVDELLDLVAWERSPPQAPASRLERTSQPTPPTGEPAVVDLEAGLKAFGADKAKYGELLHKFVTVHQGDVEESRRLFNAADFDGATEIIHGLCGVASFLQVHKVASVARRAEAALQSGPAETVLPLLDELAAALRAAQEFIEQYDAATVRA